MLKIRLRRTGARKKPNYRVVIAESTSPRDGSFIEIIGTYDPLTDPSTVRIDDEKARHWLRNGAQPTERVAKLLAGIGIGEGPRGWQRTAPVSPAESAPTDAGAAPAQTAVEEPAATAIVEPAPAAAIEPAPADAEAEPVPPNVEAELAAAEAEAEPAPTVTPA